MHILQITPTYYPELQFGGPPQKIHALSRGLVRHGHTVTVATLDSTRPGAAEQTTMDGVTVQYLPWLGRGPYRWPRRWSRLANLVRQADVVHSYGLYNLLGPAGAYFARQAQRPFVLEPLGMYVPRTRKVRLKRLYHRLFTLPMARHAALLIATSPGELAELRDLVSDRRLVLRGNGLDLAYYAALPAGDAFRRQHHIPAGDHLILYIGRISPIKNLDGLITAFAAADLPHSHLLLVGPQLEADYARQLQQQIAASGLTGRVRLPGPLYDEAKLAALAAADLLVLPSHYESYGNAAAEAVAAGLPVLLTESCGIAPLIHRRAGLAVPATPAGLAAGLRTLLTDETARRQNTQGRAQLLPDLSWEQPLAHMIQLYEQLQPPVPPDPHPVVQTIHS